MRHPGDEDAPGETGAREAAGSDLVLDRTTELGAEIEREHEACCRAATSAIEHARRAGELLIQAKATQPHGTWLPWLAANAPSLSERTAQGYMRVARRWSELAGGNPQRVADLPLRQALAELAEPQPKTWEPPPPDPAFVPPDGCTLFLTRRPGDNLHVIPCPENPGYYWICRMVAGPGEDPGASTSYTRRPVHAAFVKSFAEHVGFFAGTGVLRYVWECSPEGCAELRDLLCPPETPAQMRTRWEEENEFRAALAEQGAAP